MRCVHSRPPDLEEAVWSSARSCHPPDTFRPCRSSRLRRFPPHRHLAGLLRPAAGHGVRHVSSAEPLAQRVGLAAGAVPDGASPFEAFPSTAAVPRHRDRCPLAVLPRLPSQSSSIAAPDPVRVRLSVDLRALLRRRVRCSVPAFPPKRCPMLPWALVPLEGFGRRFPSGSPKSSALGGSVRALTRSARTFSPRGDFRIGKGLHSRP
jgi:hypothetical protein